MRSQGRFETILAAAAYFSAAVLFGSSVSAQSGEETVVDLELVIAVDVSLSMDLDEQTLQREGYVRAFLDPQVINAIEQGLHGKIAVAYVEWAGAISQYLSVDWVLIDGRDAAAEMSALLAEAPIARLRRTSISGALMYSGGLFEDNGFRGLRRVIDVSGDGPNNQGGRVDAARDAVVEKGITVNGLPFVPDPSGGPLSLFDLPQLDIYYEDCVIGGPGAFSLPVRSAQEFAEAIRNKLVLEIAGIARPRLIRVSATTPRISCTIGEQQWDMFMNGN
jgi:hypothetical protein